ncbi:MULTISPECIES: SRPBCC domain-containing protein [unclassified Streptomyces]|uniref:SRPBCC domain-containing protein n=1 Tax=unclassified Streptomyces TaxID=2593676 RepID=UPI0036F75976
MEHEVFVPVPAERLRAALADPARLARAVPGLQRDAGAQDGTDLTGRLKLRVGSHSVTYRGTLRLTGRDDGCAIEGEATEARGSGTVKLTLTARATPTEGGTTLTVSATATADGRITELPPDEVTSALTRLLNRTAEQLGEEATQGPEQSERATEEQGEAPDVPESPEQLAAGSFETAATSDFDTAPDADDDPAPSVFDVDVPPPSLDPLSDEDGTAEPTADALHATDDAGALAEVGATDAMDDADDFPDADRPPAEAAHARRTMIGRSAEEVDHAPPRGRYAPVPAPQSSSAATTLRWVAPAAVAVLASAIVMGRVLRRRH